MAGVRATAGPHPHHIHPYTDNTMCPCIWWRHVVACRTFIASGFAPCGVTSAWKRLVTHRTVRYCSSKGASRGLRET